MTTSGNAADPMHDRSTTGFAEIWDVHNPTLQRGGADIRVGQSLQPQVANLKCTHATDAAWYRFQPRVPVHTAPIRPQSWSAAINQNVQLQALPQRCQGRLRQPCRRCACPGRRTRCPTAACLQRTILQHDKCSICTALQRLWRPCLKIIQEREQGTPVPTDTACTNYPLL